MGLLVVDANVVVQACIDAGGLGPLKGHELVGPPVLPSEALSALHELRFRGEISREQATLGLERLVAFAYEVRRPGNLTSTAWAVADSLGWAKTYDAEYVALAQILDCRLVTLDARLARGAGKFASIVGPADL